MPSISDPIQVGSLLLKNRFVVASTFTNNNIETDFVGPNLLNSYEREGKGGAALVTVQASYVHPQGRGGFARRLGIHQDRCINSLEELSAIIKRGGASAAIQIQHARFHSKGDETPGGEAADFSSFGEERIQTAIDAFGQAAARAKRAGFDAVEIHACHGSLVAQFFSPRINQRNDRWGKNRALFPLKVLESVRRAVGPDYPVIIRFSAEEAVDHGFTIDDTLKWVPEFEKAGADAIHVSNGSRSGLAARAAEVQPIYFPMGPTLKFARAVKGVTSLPVIAVGKIMTPTVARQVVAKGWGDLVGLSRAIIADPEFPRKALAGRDAEVRQCIGCNYCYRRVAFNQMSIRCAVNPERGREDRYRSRPVRRKKRIMVVGGGIAGMEAARIAAWRGHTVTLYEQSDRLGGQINLAVNIPRLITGTLLHIVSYQKEALKRLGVKIRLNATVIFDVIQKKSPDAVVLATGARFVRPELPGIDAAPVMLLDDFLKDQPTIGDRVVILGGKEGAETAAGLAKKGHSVTLIHTGPEPEVGFPYYIHGRFRSYYLREYLRQNGVIILSDAVPIDFKDGKLRVEPASANRQTIEGDIYILAVERQSHRSLADSLKAVYTDNIYEAGDCVSPRSIVEAVDDGAFAGREV